MAGASGLLRCYVLADCRAYGNKTPWPDAITHLSATAMPTKPGRAGCNTRWSATEYRNACARDRKSVVSGKGVAVRVDLGGRRIIQSKNPKHGTNSNIVT